MPDLTITISENDALVMRRLASIGADRAGQLLAVSLEDMAAALLRAHLVLIQDCPNILPAASAGGSPPRFSSSRAGKISLGGGINAK